MGVADLNAVLALKSSTARSQKMYGVATGSLLKQAWPQPPNPLVYVNKRPIARVSATGEGEGGSAAVLRLFAWGRWRWIKPSINGNTESRGEMQKKRGKWNQHCLPPSHQFHCASTKYLSLRILNPNTLAIAYYLGGIQQTTNFVAEERICILWAPLVFRPKGCLQVKTPLALQGHRTRYKSIDLSFTTQTNTTKSPVGVLEYWHWTRTSSTVTDSSTATGPRQNLPNCAQPPKPPGQKNTPIQDMLRTAYDG